MIAVIVPAHDEEQLIGRCLQSIQVAAAQPWLRGEPVLTIVALDDCSDGTASICADYGIATVVLDQQCVGAARAAAAAYALTLGARWIASTDADTVVPPEWLWKQARFGADAFCGVVEVDDWQDYPIAVQAAFLGGEATCDGHRHIHGANMGISASAYQAAGGFPSLSTGEDVALITALIEAGAAIAWHAQPTVLTSARRLAKAPHGFSGFLRALECEVISAGCTLPPTQIMSK